ncbi:DUF1269 domain-containing protein [Noviherbaspirillum pedocola]|uniref:DUF1269 domain-containing protein n=1 Tax=Noviherbaspirillum pedocola TaxID=2801341 RepID=A0A934SSV0_9BURK|nr:DUF1269 domain-containing protein [Noviherbaspirillum pedocola]MBK4734613.1 DUF1269 domain-containing protein [Noviherbaspirillum pedocola]
MADLIAVAYSDTHKAEEVLSTLRRLQGEYLVDLEDAAYVTRDRDGRVRLTQAVNIPLLGAVSGIAWGGLIGLLFLNPLLGAAIGAGTGALTGAVSDYGINDDFMRGLGEKLQPGGSAIFILARRFTPDKFAAELARFGGTVLQTSLTRDTEAKLQQALSGTAGDSAGGTVAGVDGGTPFPRAGSADHAPATPGSSGTGIGPGVPT